MRLLPALLALLLAGCLSDPAPGGGGEAGLVPAAAASDPAHAPAASEALHATGLSTFTFLGACVAGACHGSWAWDWGLVEVGNATGPGVVHATWSRDPNVLEVQLFVRRGGDGPILASVTGVEPDRLDVPALAPGTYVVGARPVHAAGGAELVARWTLEMAPES